MKIQYVTGDLLAAPQRIIAHGCNAQGKMNSGVAKLIRDAYPLAFIEYERQWRSSKTTFLGTANIVDCGNRVVCNLITQEFYGREPNTLYVSYEALENAFQMLNSFMGIAQTIPDSYAYKVLGSGPHEIAMPLIGAGLAQGSWTRIQEIIERVSTNFQPIVYTLDGVIPKS